MARLTRCDSNAYLSMLVSRAWQLWKGFKWADRAMAIFPCWFIIPVFETDEDLGIVALSTGTVRHVKGQLPFFRQLTVIDYWDLAFVVVSSEDDHLSAPNYRARTVYFSSAGSITESNPFWLSATVDNQPSAQRFHVRVSVENKYPRLTLVLRTRATGGTLLLARTCLEVLSILSRTLINTIIVAYQTLYHTFSVNWLTQFNKR